MWYYYNSIFFRCSRVEVLTTLTTDVGKILAKLHQVQPSGDINFLTGMRIAHVSLFFWFFFFAKWRKKL
jgi:hypothetical protein